MTLETGARVGAYRVAADGSLVAVKVARTARTFAGPTEYGRIRQLMRADTLADGETLAIGAGPDKLAGRIHVYPRAVRVALRPVYVGRFHAADDGSRVVTDWNGPIAVTRYGRARKVARKVARKATRPTVARKVTRPTNYAAERVMAGYIGWLD